MKKLTCSAGHQFAETEARFTGYQEVTQGDWLPLYQCPSCDTTVGGVEIHDACRCVSCAELIRGDVGDPKVFVEEGAGPMRVYCAGCAPRPILPRLRRAPLPAAR